MSRTASFGFLAFSLSAIALLNGCGGPPPTATVSGSVTIQGKSITFGMITFQSEVKNVPNPVRSGEIRNGKYSVAEVPVGPTTVAIQSIPVDPKPGPSPKGSQPAEPPPAGPYVAIPTKYNAAATSGLTYDVTNGAQTKDFPLAP
jgi:hypothetical protein